MPDKQTLSVLLPAATDNGDGSITMRGYPLLIACKPGHRSVVLEGVEIASAAGVVEVWSYGSNPAGDPRRIPANGAETSIRGAFADRANPLYLALLNCSADGEVLIGVRLAAYADGE